MKRGVLVLVGIVMLAGLNGCTGSWPLTPTTVTVTTTSTVYTPSPKPPDLPLVCRTPTDEQLVESTLPGGLLRPNNLGIAEVDFGVDGITGSSWLAIAYNALDDNGNATYYGKGATVVSEASNSLESTYVYGVDLLAQDPLKLVPLTGASLARARDAVFKALDCATRQSSSNS